MAKKTFSKKTSLSKSNVSKVPNNKPAVYKIKNQKGKNIYTGVAQKGRVQDRLAEHMPKGTDPIPGAKSFSYKPKGSINSAKVEEKRIIKTEKPRYNELGK